MGPSADGLHLERRREFPEPFLLGVVSDTHLYPRNPGNALEQVIALFARFHVDVIAHAGDVNSMPVLARLSNAAPLLVVAGNNDDSDLLAVAPEEIEFTVGRKRFALMHGHGGASARAEAKRRFGGQADCVVYGHSHIPMIEKIDGTIYFNPGSAEQRRWHPHFGLGLIRVANDRIEPELILWEHPSELANVMPD